jgi:hypothetical protein
MAKEKKLFLPSTLGVVNNGGQTDTRGINVRTSTCLTWSQLLSKPEEQVQVHPDAFRRHCRKVSPQVQEKVQFYSSNFPTRESWKLPRFLWPQQQRLSCIYCVPGIVPCCNVLPLQWGPEKGQTVSCQDGSLGRDTGTWLETERMLGRTQQVLRGESLSALRAGVTPRGWMFPTVPFMKGRSRCLFTEGKSVQRGTRADSLSALERLSVPSWPPFSLASVQVSINKANVEQHYFKRCQIIRPLSHQCLNTSVLQTPPVLLIPQEETGREAGCQRLLTPVILTIWEAEIGRRGSKFEASPGK